MPSSRTSDVSEAARLRARGSRRGTYDRHLSPSERVKAQRTELLMAVRQVVLAGEVPSVSSIAAARGLGRNTFYEHFSTVDAAVAACVEECAATLELQARLSLDEAAVATPSERARSLGSTLFTLRDEQPDCWQVLAVHGPKQLDAVIRRAVQ